MYKVHGRVWVAGCVLLLAACGRTDAPGGAAAGPQAGSAPPATPAPTVWEAMTQAIIPASNTIWELAGNLWNDAGNIDASRLSPEQWAQLKQAAQAMGDSAAALAGAGKLATAPPGGKILNEGTAGALGAAEVQALIDADPQAFKDAAASLAAMAEELAAASDVKDGAKTDSLSNQLTDVCGACHMRFWTPGQPQ